MSGRTQLILAWCWLVLAGEAFVDPPGSAWAVLVTCLAAAVLAGWSGLLALKRERDVRQLRRIVRGMARRVAEQSEVLGRRAERR